MADSVYYNQPAEESLIGLAMRDPKSLRAVTELSPNAFYFPEHRTIHEALCALAREKSGIDMVTVTNWLIKNQKLDAAGGPQIVARIYAAGISTVMLKEYLKIVQECFSRRQQRKATKEYAAKLDAGEGTEDAREWMLQALKDVKEIRDNGLISMQDAALQTFEQLDQDQKREDQPTNRILSGISTLDNKLGGLRGSEYVAIGARPSVGKSIFALTYCINAAKQGKRVLLVSLEMDEVQITERVLASQGGGTLNEITSGNISEEGWQKLTSVIPAVSNLPLWYSTTANTVEKVRRCAYEMFENGGIDLIAVDYIQLMEEPGNGRMNRQEEISKISRGLRQMAAELKIPILVLTQLNRTSAKGTVIKGNRVRMEPTMSEARESGAIEQDANIFMLLHDPDESEMRSEEEKTTCKNLKAKGLQMMRIIIDKNRQGKRGRVTLAFDGDHMRFMPIARDTETPY